MTRWNGPAVAALVAPWGLMLCNIGYALATRNGGSDSTAADALALARAEGPTLRFTVLAGMLGALLMVPAAVAAARLAGSRLGSFAGTLTAAGYACYLAVLLSDVMTLAMAAHGGPLGDFAAAMDAFQEDPLAAWVFLLFVAGNLIGTLLLGIALWRSGRVPRWAAAAVLAWPPLHVVGLAMGVEWFEVAGAALQGAGFAVVAVRLLQPARTLVGSAEPVASLR